MRSEWCGRDDAIAPVGLFDFPAPVPVPVLSMPMSSDPQEIAGRGQQMSVALMRLLAGSPEAALRTGDGWFAVHSGIDSNDMNGVVSDRGTVLPEPLIRELVGWVTAGDCPASWLTVHPDAALTEVLLSIGAHPERTGNWCGADLAEIDLDIDLAALDTGGDTSIAAVRDHDDLADWLRIADACGWFGDDHGEHRARIYRDVGLDGPLQHWVARVDGAPVGFASALIDDDVVDLCNLGVLDSHRRRGIGRALALHRLRIARDLGAEQAVAAPSPDGWALHRTIGFTLAPVVPDVCFYLSPAPR